MKTLLKLADRVVVHIEPDETVQHAVELMLEHQLGAVAVISKGKLVGIFSERDLLRRVVGRKLSADKTLVGEVMTEPVKMVLDIATTDDAFRLMHEGQFRHLPVVEKTGKFLGMVSVLDLLKNRIEELNQESKNLAAFIAADGSGG